MRFLGLDPGLRKTGWGVIESAGHTLRYVDAGCVVTEVVPELARRLASLHEALNDVLVRYLPDEAAVEETFVNRNAGSTLKLGQARGVAMLAPAIRGIPVAEYAALLVKKSVTGNGHAGKEQVHAMVTMLLPGFRAASFDAADALAVAICHAHHRATAAKVRAALAASEARG